MKNLLKKQSDTQIIAHSVLQKHYAQIRGLQASQSGQRRSLVSLNLLHLQVGGGGGAMSRRGFGKSPQALPVRAKGKKARGKLEEYVLIHHGRDGNVRVLRLRASSLAEASRKFNVFVDTLNLCLSQASDEEILRFIEENPL